MSTRSSRCPPAHTERRAMPKMYDYRTIVVGTDGSPLAVPTVARAAWLAAHDDADLVIVCAYSELSRRDEARNVATPRWRHPHRPGHGPSRCQRRDRGGGRCRPGAVRNHLGG